MMASAAAMRAEASQAPRRYWRGNSRDQTNLADRFYSVFLPIARASLNEDSALSAPVGRTVVRNQARVAERARSRPRSPTSHECGERRNDSRPVYIRAAFSYIRQLVHSPEAV